MQTARSGSPQVEIVTPDPGEDLRCVRCGSQVDHGIRDVATGTVACRRNCLILWARANGIRRLQ